MHQSCPGVRRRRDSHPSIHLPRAVNLPGTNTAGSGFSRFDRGAKKSSFAASARPPTRADARSARAVNAGSSAAAAAFELGILWPMLAHSAYGKSRVRLVQVSRQPDRHDLRDLTIGIRFEGQYDESYTEGDNTQVLPTDTMKNTVYALAAREPVREPETFGLRSEEHTSELQSL